MGHSDFDLVTHDLDRHLAIKEREEAAQAALKEATNQAYEAQDVQSATFQGRCLSELTDCLAEESTDAIADCFAAWQKVANRGLRGDDAYLLMGEAFDQVMVRVRERIAAAAVNGEVA